MHFNGLRFNDFDDVQVTVTLVYLLKRKDEVKMIDKMKESNIEER